MTGGGGVGGSSSTAPPPPITPTPPKKSSPLTNLRSAISHPQQQVTLTCYIPPSKVGAVIGRGGKTIINLQREASRQSQHPHPIRMSVASSGSYTATPTGDDLWTPVIIRGDPVGCFTAASLLLPLVDDEMDDVVMDIPIQRNKHSAIIGRKGGTISVLSADHNVRIMVPSPRNHSGNNSVDQPLFPPPEKENLNVIQLEGEVGDVEQCLVKLLQVVTGELVIGGGADGSGQGGANSPATGTSTNNTVEKTVTAPAGREDLPSLGKLRQIGKKTNTIVRRKRVERGEDDVETHFTISGKADCVDSAVQILGKMFLGEESSSSSQHQKENISSASSKDEQPKQRPGGQQGASSSNQTSGGRGRGKGGRGGRGGPGRGNNAKFSQRGGRGRGSTQSSPSTAS